MSKINSSDIETLMNSAASEFLNSDCSDSKGISGNISSFFTTSKDKLSGEIWDRIREKYSKYDSLLQKQSKIGLDINDAISSILKNLMTSLDGESDIDTSELPDLISSKEAAESAIASLSAKVGEKPELQSQINSQNGILQEINKRIEKMEKINAIVEEATGKIAELQEEITKFSQEVSSISPSKKVAFDPTIVG